MEQVDPDDTVEDAGDEPELADGLADQDEQDRGEERLVRAPHGQGQRRIADDPRGGRIGRVAEERERQGRDQDDRTRHGREGRELVAEARGFLVGERRQGSDRVERPLRDALEEVDGGHESDRHDAPADLAGRNLADPGEPGQPALAHRQHDRDEAKDDVGGPRRSRRALDQVDQDVEPARGIRTRGRGGGFGRGQVRADDVGRHLGGEYRGADG